MYKIGINQNEESNYKQKPNVKQEKKHWLKIFSLLFIVITLILTTMVLIIANNQWNSSINTNNSNNWSPNQDKNWEDYYEHNCPPNKKYNLTDYKENLKNISLISTNKKLKNFYLSDLLEKIDNVLQTNKIDIPNNFFAHLPVNPAINIKINDENALKNNFSIKIPSYKEKIKQFKIEISVSQLGSNYGLVPCDFNFNFNVENDVMPEKFNISDLVNKITISPQTILMLDVTKGTKNEIESQISKIIEEKFLEKINTEKSLSNKVTKDDFDINYDSIKNFDNYMTQKKLTIIIFAKDSSEVIKGQLNITLNVQGTWRKKSLSIIKRVLENDESITNELITVEDNTNVSKVDIDNHIALLISKKINEFGKEKWHQDFSDQDYIITSNADSGNYQKVKTIIVTIVGRKQLQDTIQLSINIQCQNKEPNEKTFNNSNFNIKNLNSIDLYPNVHSSGVIYPITFKDNSVSLISLLFQEAIDDMNDFTPINNISLEMNIGINLDGDNYQIHFQGKINFEIIKKINNIVLISDSEQNGEYQHLKNIGIIIKYNGDKEYKIIQPFDVNIKNNNLTFINFSSIVKITSQR